MARIIIVKVGKSIDSEKQKASYIDSNNSSPFSLEKRRKKRRKVFISSGKTLLNQLVIMIKKLILIKFIHSIHIFL